MDKVISSLVVFCGEGDNAAVADALFAPDPRVEVVAQSPGRIGIVIETDSTKDAQAFMELLSGNPLVKNVTLAYHNFEKEAL